MNITIITTGGTIAKTYDEHDGSLRNDKPVIESIVASMRLPDLTISYRHILYKDSTELTETDRRLILEATRSVLSHSDAVILAHGTDTLAVTGEQLFKELGEVVIPVILTGAMRPYEFRNSDAGQNLTEALLACRLLSPGIYAVLHNRILRFPGVIKDLKNLSFINQKDAES